MADEQDYAPAEPWNYALAVQRDDASAETFGVALEILDAPETNIEYVQADVEQGYWKTVLFLIVLIVGIIVTSIVISKISNQAR